MTKVLFAHKHHPIEPLGIAYVSSAIAEGGHESRLMLTPKDIEEASEQVSDMIREYNPDIFAQSIIFGTHLYAADLNKKVKERFPGLVTVLGGPAATFTPELIEKGYDVICRYEGEAPFLEFCNALEEGSDVGNIQNLWVKENPDLYVTERKKIKEIKDIDDPDYLNESGFDSEKKRFVNATRQLLQGPALDAVSFPDRELLYSQKIYADGPIKHFMHTRGCAFRCSYCFNVIQNMQNKGRGKTVRRRTHDSVVDEINQVRENWPTELVYFQDDVFGPTYRVEDTIEFAEVYSKEVGIPFHCHVRFDLVCRPGIAKALAEAGCSGVHVAIEAGDDFIRNKVHRRDMSTQQVIDGAKALRKYGIKMMTQNILGAPGETKEQMLKTLELNIEVAPVFASASIFQPYPGTTALEYARDNGSLPSKDLNELSDMFGLETFYNKSILILDPKEKRWLEVFQKFFAIGVENPSLYQSGALDRIVSSYPEGEEAEESLRRLYRGHRAGKDEELYNVRLKDVVGEDE